MNGSTASEKLGLDSTVRELKFGSSFSGKGSSYHTIRYDFRPASVDTSKMASLEVQGGTVTISMPNADGQGSNVFAGPRKAYQKECVLIIDPETGEFTLEKLTHSIQVKKTRQERDGSSTKPSGKAPAPASKDPATSQKPSTVPMPSSSSTTSTASSRSQPAQSSSDRKTVTSKSSAASSSSNRRPESPLLTLPARSSPVGRSPHLSPPSGSLPGGNNAFDALLSQHSKQQKEKPQPPPHTSLPSLSTDFEDLLSSAAASASPGRLSTCSSSSSIGSPDRGKQRTPPSAQLHHNSSSKPLADFKGPDEKALLSDDDDDSSSSSSSSSGSSSEDSSDDDEDNDMEVVPEGDPKLPSMPMFGDFMPAPTGLPPSAMASAGGGGRAMPSHLLSEDLQLSETGSDSD